MTPLVTACHHQGAIFWCSSIRLDSDPLNKRTSSLNPICNKNPDGSVNCAVTEPMSICVYPGWLARTLFLTAFPAFLLGVAIVDGLGRVGVSQVWSFMLSMPLLISVWFHFMGWLLDRWLYRRSA